jgi:hypothetical protein
MFRHRRTIFIQLGQHAAGLLLLLACVSPASAGLAIDPAVACRLLDSQGLRTRDGYRDSGHGLFQCQSAQHRLPRGSIAGEEVRYVATGDPGRVRTLQLDLSLRSRGELRPVLESFGVLAEALTAGSLGLPLPRDAAASIAQGVPGSWKVGGADLALERIVGALPALRFVIR